MQIIIKHWHWLCLPIDSSTVFSALPAHLSVLHELRSVYSTRMFPLALPNK